MPRMKTLLLAAAMASIALAGQALAHAHLKSSAPAANSTVKQAPSVLDLSFTESLNLKFSGATVTGPDKKTIKTGDAALADGTLMRFGEVRGRRWEGV